MPNTDAGGKYTTYMNADGVYALLSVPPRMHALEASKEGFKSNFICNFRVAVSLRAVQNIVLVIGSTSVAVTVDATDSGSLWEPTSNELGTELQIAWAIHIAAFFTRSNRIASVSDLEAMRRVGKLIDHTPAADAFNEFTLPASARC